MLQSRHTRTKYQAFHAKGTPDGAKQDKRPLVLLAGTAQESRTRPDHALFIGYAPAKQPEIALAVRIANGYGSSNATAAGKSILNFYFGLESRENILTGEASQAFNASTD